MDVRNIVQALNELSCGNPADTANLEAICEENLKTVNVSNEFQEIPGEISNAFPSFKVLNFKDESLLWKYICINLNYLLNLRDIFNNGPSDCFSVQQTKDLNNVLRNIVAVGVASNLLPKVPYYTPLPSGDVPVFIRYRRLVTTTYGLLLCLRTTHLKPLIVPNLKWILSALYQAVYCPLKKPSVIADESGFIMTEEVYNALQNDKEVFKRLFKELSSSLYITLYIRETMMLVGTISGNKTVSAPVWLQKAVHSNLSTIIRSPNGVENIARALLDAAGLDTSDDSTKSWETIDVLARMVVGYRKLPDFRENICKQLLHLLKVKSSSNEAVIPFERFVGLCTKMLFKQDETLCREIFIEDLLQPLVRLTHGSTCSFDHDDITEATCQTLRLLRSVILDQNFNIPPLPADTAFPVVNVLFHLHVTVNDSPTLNSILKELDADITGVLLHCLETTSWEVKSLMFDALLFGFTNDVSLDMRTDIQLTVEDNSLVVKPSNYAVGLRPLLKAEALKDLLKTNTKVSTSLFSYMLTCLNHPHKYFVENTSNKELLQVEDTFTLDDCLERKLAVFKLSTELAEQPDVQKHVCENPADVIDCMQTLLVQSLEKGVHKSADTESFEFQTLFVTSTLMQMLLEKISNCRGRFQQLIHSLRNAEKECVDSELAAAFKKVVQGLEGDWSEPETTENSVLEQALEDIWDPLVPVRGHGLMTLTKLIQKKDPLALEKRREILNILQLNLKSEESYLYLNAIGGLAAMGDIFPDTVINILVEEYAGYSRKQDDDGHEIRMKVGEVLVRVIKQLGEMAPKYKAVLLNAFLSGAKDEDHLVRSSSLSNLGEICRVLGYKLGSIITEVLVCVHAVIATDKAVEARRAAVSVLRQLFVGLDKEMVLFLKEEILPIYRTLKHIYRNDSDDVTRLQAQLALEELNENMKNFIFPQVQLHTGKKPFILD